MAAPTTTCMLPGGPPDVEDHIDVVRRHGVVVVVGFLWPNTCHAHHCHTCGALNDALALADGSWTCES